MLLVEVAWKCHPKPVTFQGAGCPSRVANLASVIDIAGCVRVWSPAEKMPDMANAGSIAEWIADLKEGRQEATNVFWSRYVERLNCVANHDLGSEIGEQLMIDVGDIERKLRPVRRVRGEG